MKSLSVRTCTEIALLAALIFLTGSLKIPSFIPGLEFQLSAPIAVAICAAFGFKRYIIAGCLASALSLVLGVQNLLNIAIAMQFRIVVGLLLYVTKDWWMVSICGPIASITARLTLYLLFGKMTWALIMAAFPGYIFTAIMAPILWKILEKVRRGAHLGERKAA